MQSKHQFDNRECIISDQSKRRIQALRGNKKNEQKKRTKHKKTRNNESKHNTYPRERPIASAKRGSAKPAQPPDDERVI